MVLTKEVLELIGRAVSRLKQYLLLSVLAIIIGIVGGIAIVGVTVMQIIVAHNVNMFPLLVSISLLLISLLSVMRFAADVLYYDASKKLAIWQSTFRSYKTVALVSILLTIIVISVSVYMMSIVMSVISEVVNSVLETGVSISRPEVLEMLLWELLPKIELLSLFSALSSLVGNVIGIYLVGIFRDIKDSFTAEASETSEKTFFTTLELIMLDIKLDDATKFLRIALILFLVGQGLSYIRLGVVGVLLEIAGFVLWFLGIARAWGGLNSIRDAALRIMALLETKT